ncbi:MAG: twin-arginine translocase TatA/TatE family subunit [Erythrobacter sp.]
MGSFSLWHWIIVLVIVLVLFGRGRISEMMGDFGKGISSFKKGLNETEEVAAKASRIEPPAAPVETSAQTTLDKSDSTGS